MVKVALIGAGGFIGGRAVEMLHLSGLAEVRPVVRSVISLARLARFDLDCRIADGRDEAALREALSGCDVVVHSIAGDPDTILGTLASTYRAAQRAGVRRFIYMSTASVHGYTPKNGEDETTPLRETHPIHYCNAKVRAERSLLQLRKAGTVELVLLRPGIVYGPRSFWTTSFASDLLAGQAYMVNEGKGICNGVYVDNVVHALHLAMTAPGIDGEAFLIGDREEITWADLYRPIAEAFGLSLREAAHLVGPFSPATPTFEQRARAAAAFQPLRNVAALLPRRVRRAAKAAVAALLKPQPQHKPSSPWALPEQQSHTAPVPTPEMSLLHQCGYKLPFTKAQTMLGYEPPVSFAEGCHRTIGWLAFAGYPVVAPHQLPAPHASLAGAQSGVSYE